MPEEILPDDPSVRTMLRWIAATYHMTQASLARMFERSEKTIHSWMKDGAVSPEILMKVRASYFHLHNAKDPHQQDRKCGRCGLWRPMTQYPDRQPVCAACLAVPKKRRRAGAKQGGAPRAPTRKTAALSVSRKARG